MSREPRSKQIFIDSNNSYEYAFVTLVENVKRGMAHQKIEECLSPLLKLGCSKKDLREYVISCILQN